MEQKQTLFLGYNGGHLAEVYDWRVAGSLGGDTLQWRFRMQDNRTLVVKPLPIPSNERPLCVPGHIHPALGAATWPILLVHQRCSVIGGPDQYIDHNAIKQQARQQVGHAARDVRDNVRTALSEKAEKEDPAKWQAAHEQHITGLFTKTFGTALAKATAEEKAQRLAKFKAEFGTEKKRRNFIYAQLCSQHQKQHPEIWSKAKAEDDAESAAEEKLCKAAAEKLAAQLEKFYRELSLYEINSFLKRHTGESPVAVAAPIGPGFTVEEHTAIVTLLENSELLNEIRKFILEQVRPAGEPSNTIVTQADCQRLVDFIGQKVCKDLRLSVLKAYHAQMPDWLNEWARELAKTRGITEEAAMKHIISGLQFIAECEGSSGSLYIYPIEDLAVDVPDKADAAPYEIGNVSNFRTPVQGTGAVVTNTATVSEQVPEFFSEFAVATGKSFLEQKNLSTAISEHTAELQRELIHVKVLVRPIEKYGQQIEAVAKGQYELQKENDELRRLHAEGYFKFALKVDAADFQAFAVIIALGNRKAAAEHLKIPNRSFYDRVKKWETRGREYQLMLRFIVWRKRSSRHIEVRLNESIQSAESGGKPENPETLRGVLDEMEAADSRSYPEIFHDILEALKQQNPSNWGKVRDEIVEIIKDEIPQ